MRTHGRRMIALVALGAVVLGGCSNDANEAEEDPKGTLIESLENLGDMDSMRLTMSLQSDPESLANLAAEDGSELSTEDAQKILDSSLTVAARGGEEGGQGQVQVVLNVAGDDAVEMRFVDETLFLHVDAEGLVETFGQDPAALDAVAQQAAGVGLDFVQPALEGEWLAIQGFEQLAQQLGGAVPSPDPEQQKQFFNDLKEAFENTAEVTSEGEDDVGTHLVATLPLRDLYERLLESAESLTGSVPGSTPPPASEIPDEDISVDAWVSDGSLRQVEIDFVEMAETAGEEIPEGVDRVALRIAFDEFEEEVTAPEDAVDVDIQELLQTIGGLGAVERGSETITGGANNNTVPGLGVTCAELATQNPADLKAFLSARPKVLERVDRTCPELGLMP